MRKLTIEEFIEKAKKVHGDKYDYSKSIYNGYHRRLTITCPKHGDFQQLPSNHIAGMGCMKCANELTGNRCRNRSKSRSRSRSRRCRMTTEDFIRKSRELHRDKYDYSKVKYKNNSTKICITCPIHGDFFQIPNSHLGGCGCPSCSFDNKRKNI